jgi:hypothetical protein
MGKDDDKWTWDGASEEFEKFSDLVEAYFLEGNGGHIGHDLFMASKVDITEQNKDEFAQQLWAQNQLKHGLYSANKEAGVDDFWTIEYLLNWSENCGNQFYGWLLKHTSGDTLQNVKTLGRLRIWEFRKRIYSDYGGGAPQDLQSAEEAFDKALFKGKEMQERDNVIEYLTDICSQQEKLVNLVAKERRDSYTYNDEVKLVKTIMKGLPALYVSDTENLKNMKMLEKKMIAMQGGSTFNNSEFDGEWYPDYKDLRSTLITAYRAKSKVWERQGTVGNTPFMMAGGSADSQCWDCNLTGHNRGDPVCRKSGECAGESCPGWLRKLKADGKDTMPGSGGGRSNGGGHKHGNGGNRICRFFQRTGNCRFGQQCKFTHDNNSGGGGGSSAAKSTTMLTKKNRKRMQKELLKSVEQSMLAKMGNASGGNDSDDEPRSKKGKTELYAMIAKAAEQKGWCGMTTDQAEASGMDVVLGEELHSLQYVGVDTDSSRTASTIKSDFLWLNTSKLATQGKALHGVGGGVAECGGVGPMVVAVTIDQQTGEEAVIVDPEGQFIKKSSPIDPDFRLFGQNRLKVMGLPLKQDYNDTARSGCAALQTYRAASGASDQQWYSGAQDFTA